MGNIEEDAKAPFTLDEILQIGTFCGGKDIKSQRDLDRLFCDPRLKTGYNAIAQAVRGTVLDSWCGHEIIDSSDCKPIKPFNELFPPDSTSLDLRVRFLAILNIYFQDLSDALVRFKRGDGVGVYFADGEEQLSRSETEVVEYAMIWVLGMVRTADQEAFNAYRDMTKTNSRQPMILNSFGAPSLPKDEKQSVVPVLPKPAGWLIRFRRKFEEWFGNC